MPDAFRESLNEIATDPNARRKTIKHFQRYESLLSTLILGNPSNAYVPAADRSPGGLRVALYFALRSFIANRWPSEIPHSEAVQRNIDYVLVNDDTKVYWQPRQNAYPVAIAGSHAHRNYKIYRPNYEVIKAVMTLIHYGVSSEMYVFDISPNDDLARIYEEFKAAHGGQTPVEISSVPDPADKTIERFTVI